MINIDELFKFKVIDMSIGEGLVFCKLVGTEGKDIEFALDSQDAIAFSTQLWEAASVSEREDWEEAASQKTERGSVN